MHFGFKSHSAVGPAFVTVPVLLLTVAASLKKQLPPLKTEIQ